MASRQDDVRAVLDQVKAEGRTSLTAPECKAVCDAYGIPVPHEGLATSAAEAAAIGTEIGYPIVMKIVSPDILHKTEAGGVLVGVADANAAKAGYESIVSSAKGYKSDADITGVQVQAMVAGGGQEVIVGAVTDPSFGKLVAFGLGGILVEVLKDITFRLAPTTADDWPLTAWPSLLHLHLDATAIWHRPPGTISGSSTRSPSAGRWPWRRRGSA